SASDNRTMYFLFSGRLLGRNTTSFSYLGAPATRTFSLDMALVDRSLKRSAQTLNDDDIAEAENWLNQAVELHETVPMEEENHTRKTEIDKRIGRQRLRIKFRIVQTLTQGKRFEPALALLDQILSECADEKTVEFYREQKKQIEQNYEAHQKLTSLLKSGAIQLRKGDSESALKDLGEALRLAPEDKYVLTLYEEAVSSHRIQTKGWRALDSKRKFQIVVSVMLIVFLIVATTFLLTRITMQ
ncbi:MAG: hypothetical protein RBT75_18150, partial [Anaerolineae bacterium]|nr:hypothetical protein [Anaerolineae bacterium]